jgi:hypothetical protein
MTHVLAACPFCGSSVTMIIEDHITKIIHIENENCFISSISFADETPENVAKCWNKRVVIFKYTGCEISSKECLSGKTKKISQVPVLEAINKIEEPVKRASKKWETMTDEEKEKYKKQIERIKKWKEENPEKVKQYSKISQERMKEKKMKNKQDN